MANPEKGEVDLTLAGKTYTFKLGTSALIELQEAFSTPDAAARLHAQTEAVRLRAALAKHGRHPKECTKDACVCGLAAALDGTLGDPSVAPIPGILDEVSKGRVKYVRAFLWAGLRRYHPGVTLEDVSDLLDASGEEEVRRVLQKLNLTTMPDPKDAAELAKGKAKNPPQARTKRTRGTGANSTSRPASPSV